MIFIRFNHLFSFGLIWMQGIIKELGNCLEESQGELRGQPDYLSLRSGQFNVKAGFTITADPLYAKPSILLDDSIAPEYNLASSSLFSEFDYKLAMENEAVPLGQRMCDHITEIGLQDASIKLLSNQRGELLKIETTLTQII